MSERSKTRQDLATAIIDRLDDKYDLIYVDYRDQLTDVQVSHLVSGDTEKFYESLEEFESDARYRGVKSEIEELQSEVITEWRKELDDGDDVGDQRLTNLDDNFYGSQEWEDVRAAVEERDSGDWLKQLASQTGRVLLRIAVDAIDEDAGFSYRKNVTPQVVLDAINFEHTEHNVKETAYLLAEHEPEFGVTIGYWIVSAEVSALLDLPNGGYVVITDPHLYLGNPFSGSGFVTDNALQGQVLVPRGDLRTDKDAFGYGWNEICGGVTISAYEAKIEPAAIVTCRHCGRSIVDFGGRWIDPEATGDDSIWRESCEDHDTFTAEHEPQPQPQPQE